MVGGHISKEGFEVISKLRVKSNFSSRVDRSQVSKDQSRAISAAILALVMGTPLKKQNPDST
eukprot:6732-Amphidinium_carterae.1